MKSVKQRNAAFTKLVRETKNFQFKDRICIYNAFAEGAGCAFKFDADGWELWANASPSARILFKVKE